MNVQKNPARVASMATISAVLVAAAGPAAAQGLSGARSILETFRTEILGIVPILAVIALVLLGIGYAMKMVDKDTFVRWGIGCIIAGGATGIANMIFTGGA